MTAMTRRHFLKTSGAIVAVLALSSLEPAAPTASHAWAADGSDAYGDWRDLFRQKWNWDKVARCSHTRTNCLSSCAWHVYVKDGIAVREEQAQSYDHGGRADCPDFFPRGCQKGATYSSLMAAPSRLKYPLKRVGERGGGKWKRISWDEALDLFADEVIDAAVESGPETVVYDQGTTNMDFGPGTAAELRLVNLMRAAHIEDWAGVGDMPMGCVQTWGMFNCEGTSDDWFRSDCIVIWSGNPVYTRIPDMHFITEARYRGAKVIVVAPDYNATAVHADLWANPRIETDTALALSVAHVLIEEDLIDRPYVREQTDLPLLVRKDDGRFLRESDLKRRGKDDVFYFWNAKKNALMEAPGSQGQRKPTLALGDAEPALEGSYRVALPGGGTVEVEPVFEVLRRQLRESYAPQATSETTGVPASVVRRIARDIGEAGSAMIFASWGACKHYHSDLMHRSFALLMALTGNQGKAGGGLRLGAWWRITGFERLAGNYDLKWWQGLLLRFIGRPPVREIEKAITKRSWDEFFTPLMPWLYTHAGYAKMVSEESYNDVVPGLSHKEAMKTALEDRLVPVYPAPGKDPRVFFFSAPNPLRRWPTPQLALKNLWPKLRLIVNANFRMSTTGMYSDLLLPAAAYYEKDSIKYSQSYLPYIVLASKAVEPLGEARDEWWIFGTLARRIQQRARARNISVVKDGHGKDFDLKTLFDRWSAGRFDPEDCQTAMRYIFETSEVFGGTTWEKALERGIIPVTANGMYSVENAVCSDPKMEEPTYPNSWQVDEKEAWPTLTGRQQFYIDHDWFVRAGEVLPVHKDPPAAGGNYPLRLTGGHTRWSIHAIWRDHDLMLRMQRGEPALWLNAEDARARGVSDNDRVRVFNDVGSFECVAKPSESVRPGQVVMYHAWEPHQFAGHKGQGEPVPSPWKVLHLAGGYGHLHYRVSYGAPSHGPRGTTIEVERV